MQIQKSRNPEMFSAINQLNHHIQTRLNISKSHRHSEEIITIPRESYEILQAITAIAAASYHSYLPIENLSYQEPEKKKEKEFKKVLPAIHISHLMDEKGPKGIRAEDAPLKSAQDQVIEAQAFLTSALKAASDAATLFNSAQETKNDRMIENARNGVKLAEEIMKDANEKYIGALNKVYALKTKAILASANIKAKTLLEELTQPADAKTKKTLDQIEKTAEQIFNVLNQDEPVHVEKYQALARLYQQYFNHVQTFINELPGHTAEQTALLNEEFKQISAQTTYAIENLTRSSQDKDREKGPHLDLLAKMQEESVQTLNNAFSRINSLLTHSKIKSKIQNAFQALNQLQQSLPSLEITTAKSQLGTLLEHKELINADPEKMIRVLNQVKTALNQMNSVPKIPEAAEAEAVTPEKPKADDLPKIIEMLNQIIFNLNSEPLHSEGSKKSDDHRRIGFLASLSKVSDGSDLSGPQLKADADPASQRLG